MTDVAQIAAGLTEAQREAVKTREIIVLRSRWDTRIALNLERKGLAERGRHLNQFVWTPLGLAVRAFLETGRC